MKEVLSKYEVPLKDPIQIVIIPAFEVEKYSQFTELLKGRFSLYGHICGQSE